MIMIEVPIGLIIFTALIIGIVIGWIGGAITAAEVMKRNGRRLNHDDA
ncbi:hypothetical protein [Phyllobacterium leguminum]|uniref:Uncharacterized protein n=1 Tax=Phyllobacterium leguminum TaxID=314237 RepID=A0A318T5U5_9HYPH|nr:hypothetical protein [Phyllobacterium leguminum]PYE89654.1 hypothetical protein C7477_103162 [Phyllobacterium leguminum]